jgi:hypothetical protein
MFQIETPGVLNGYLVFPEHVMINIRNISWVYEVRRHACFVNLQGKIKRIYCESVKMNYFPESY